MKRLIPFAICLLLALRGEAQQISHDSIKLSRTATHYVKISDNLAREINIYTNRKYSYGFSESLYGWAKNTTIFHALDGMFSDRFRELDLGTWASFEATGGASFQPYQGFRLHLGFDYEWLTPWKIHLYLGAQFAQGLRQNTLASNSLSSVLVGSHSYIVPFIGAMYWPGKRDIKHVDKNNSFELLKLRNPTFWELAYFKAQVGYSALLTRLSVTPSETFDQTTASNIRRNVSSCLYLSFGIGINLPSFGNTKLVQTRLLQQLHAY